MHLRFSSFVVLCASVSSLASRAPTIRNLGEVEFETIRADLKNSSSPEHAEEEALVEKAARPLLPSRQDSALVQKSRGSNIGNDRRNVNWTLNELEGVDPKEVAVDAILGIVNLDWSAPLGPQFVDIAMAFAPSIASMINPLLGAVFSIFAGLFGWGEANGNAVFVQNILKKVDMLITQRLNDFATQMVKNAISGAMLQIEAAGDEANRWDHIPVALADKFPHVFLNCWNYPESSACETWRKEGSAGQGLMLEMQFTELMILATATVAEHGHQFSSMAENVWKAAQLTVSHFQTFWAFRANKTSGAKGGLTIARVICDGHYRNPRCQLSASKDNLLKKDLCKMTVRTGGTARASMERDRDVCISKHRILIEEQIDALLPQITVNYYAAHTLVLGGPAPH